MSKIKLIIIGILLLLDGFFNCCYADLYVNSEYKFSIYVPDDFVYKSPSDRITKRIMQAYNPQTLANMDIGIYPCDEVDEYGEGITDDRLVSMREFIKEKFNLTGSLVYDAGIFTIKPNHKAVYWICKFRINGKIFEMLIAQIYAHKRLYSISFGQLDGDNRMLEFMSLLKTFNCKYNH